MPQIGSLDRFIATTEGVARGFDRRRQLKLQERNYQLRKAAFEADAAEAQRLREEREAAKVMNEMQAQQIGEATMRNLREEGIQRAVDSRKEHTVLGAKFKLPDLDVVMEEVRRANEQELKNERRQEVVRQMGPEAGRRYLQEEYQRDTEEKEQEGRNQMAEKLQDMLIDHAFDDFDGTTYQPNEARMGRVEMIMEGLQAGAISPGHAMQLLTPVMNEVARENERRTAKARALDEVKDKAGKVPKNSELGKKYDKILSHAAVLEPDDIKDELFEAENGRKTARAANNPMVFLGDLMDRAMKADPIGMRTDPEGTISRYIEIVTGGMASTPAELHVLMGQQTLNEETQTQSQADEEAQHIALINQMVQSGGQMPSASAQAGPKGKSGPVSREGFTAFKEKPPEEKKDIDEKAAKAIAEDSSQEALLEFMKENGISEVDPADYDRWVTLADKIRSEGYAKRERQRQEKKRNRGGQESRDRQSAREYNERKAKERAGK